MPTYDARPTNREPGALSFPVPVRIVDPTTGARIPNVFYARTSPARIGRFLTAPDGSPLARATGRRVRGKRMDLRTAHGELIARDKPVAGAMAEYERMDIYEDRAWVAVSLATGAIVAQSDGVTT